MFYFFSKEIGENPVEELPVGAKIMEFELTGLPLVVWDETMSFDAKIASN